MRKNLLFRNVASHHPHLLFEKRIASCGNANKAIAQVTFNSPHTRNALREETGAEFQKIMLTDIANDDTIRAVVLTGSGSSFSAGGDTKFLAKRLEDSAEGNIDAMLQFYDRFLCLRRCGKPVIAALNGHAIGAGFCVALACDMRIATMNAKFAVNFSKLGIHPGMGATYFLPRLTSPTNAHRLLLTGDTIDAKQAQEMGLVQEVCADEKEVLHRALKLADHLATGTSFIAVQEIIKTFREDDHRGLPKALRREAEAQAVCYAKGADLKEALDAMKEKRTPVLQ